MVVKGLLLFFLSHVFLFSLAQHHEMGDTTKAYQNRLIPLPLVFYTPETKVGYGAIGIFLFKSGKDWRTRTSNFDFALVRTTKNQTIIEPTYTIFTKGEKYYFRGTWIMALRASELFFEPANRNLHADGLEVSFDNFKFNNKVLRKIRPHWYVGLQQQYNNPYTIDIRDDRAGNKKRKYFSTASGIGLSTLYDTRDNILNPYKGIFIDFGVTFFRKSFGSVREFTNISLDARKYYAIFPHGIIAFNAILTFNKGEIPPAQQLASLGGNTVLRGFYRGRFKERHAIVLQTEYRQRIYKRLGMTVFGGFGEVASSISTIDFKGLNYSYGAGLRYTIKKSERLNIRLDFGFGNRDSKGIYAGLSEAF
jgi:outer membrane protein assembly factor BamA